MTAWATVVAERMGFQREEALSIGEYLLHLIFVITNKAVALQLMFIRR